MNPADLEVLYEDNHLLAVSKPAGLPTMGVAADRPSLLAVAKQYVKQRYNKPGNVYLGAMSRLDCPVSGVLLLARTSKAAARLTEQFRGRTVEKTYWAVVSGPLDPPTGACVDWVKKDERHRRMHIAVEDDTMAREARLTYRTIRPLGRGTLLEVLLETGRKHQIRLQLSHRGNPILGDRKYGSRQPFGVGIALHARKLVCAHPTLKSTVELVAPLPESWREIGVYD